MRLAVDSPISGRGKQGFGRHFDQLLFAERNACRRKTFMGAKAMFLNDFLADRFCALALKDFVYVVLVIANIPNFIA